MTDVVRFPTARERADRIPAGVQASVQQILLLAPVLGRRNPRMVHIVEGLMRTYIADAPAPRPPRTTKRKAAILASHTTLQRLEDLTKHVPLKIGARPESPRR